MKNAIKTIIIVIFSLFFLVSCSNQDKDDYNLFVGMSRNDILDELSNYQILISSKEFEVYELDDKKVYIYVTFDKNSIATNVQSEKIDYYNQNKSSIIFDNSIEIDNLSFPIPERFSKIIYAKYNEVYLLSNNYNDIIEYHQKLSANNWKIIKTNELGLPYTTYINDNQALVIKDEEISPNIIEVTIHHYQGINSGDDIEDYIAIIKNTISYEEIYHIFEYDISEATEKMGLRGYYVITEKVDPVKLVIDKYNKITKINYDQFQIYDIDLDGENEFITKLGYGSDRYIVTFSVWKYNELEKTMELAYRTKYKQLDNIDMFLSKNENGVEVIAGTWNNGNLENRLSYGNLIISDDNIMPEKRDIPFEVVQ